MAQVNPWTTLGQKDTTSRIYRVEYYFDTINFTVNRNNTRPAQSSFQKFLLNELCPFMEEKNPKDPLFLLKYPIPITPCHPPSFDEASTSFMCTLLEAHKNCKYDWPKTEIIVTAGTLKIIGDAVLHPEKKWKLRAFREYFNRRKYIFLCSETENPGDLKGIVSKRNEKTLDIMSELESIIEQIVIENKNPSVNGAHFVMSKFRLEDETISACVIGTIDLLVKDKALNIAQLNGCKRTDEISLVDSDTVNECFEYIWPRSFWIGIPQILFAVRQENTNLIKAFKKMPLETFTTIYNRRKSIGNKGRLADRAAFCVAKVLFEIRRMFNSRNDDNNILVTYEGINNQGNYCPIKLSFCQISYSFWLLREMWHLKSNYNADKEVNNNNYKMYRRVKIQRCVK